MNLNINGLHSNDIPLYSVCSTMYIHISGVLPKIYFEIGSHKKYIYKYCVYVDSLKKSLY